jgi:hypothetical protein
VDRDTISVEINRELLTRLRARRPGKSDGELLEDIAVIQLGGEAVARVREAFRDVSEKDIEGEAVKAVREVRRERAARESDD